MVGVWGEGRGETEPSVVSRILDAVFRAYQAFFFPFYFLLTKLTINFFFFLRLADDQWGDLHKNNPK
jgi:hypothetical protein